MTIGPFLRQAAGVAIAVLASSPAWAQSPSLSTFAPAATGTNPTALAVNPVTKKVYVTNHDDNTVTIYSTTNQAAFPIATVPVGRQPNHVVVNTETDAVYVSNEGDGTMSVIDARTDQVRATQIVQVGGAMTVNPGTNHMFMLRESPSDEFNIVIGDTFLQASATRSYQPVTLAMNPVTNRLFVGHEATTDVVPFNMNGDAVYPTRECPDGSGGLIPDPGQSNPNPPACIDVPGYPVSIAVNPVTNRAYALTSTNQVVVIQGPNMTWSTIALPAPFNGAGPVTIAVNPVTNMVYALFDDKIVGIDGATNQPIYSQVVAHGVGLAIDIRRGILYVPTQDGSLTFFAGDSGAGAVSASGTPRAIDIDPVTGTVYVLTATGLTSAVPSNFPIRTASPITLSIRAMPNNTAAQNGSITIDAASSMAPAPLDQVRAVFYAVLGINGSNIQPYRKATRNGDGSWSASLAGLPPGGNYTLTAFATNGLEMDSINTHKAQAPLASSPASYAFSVGSASGINAPLVKALRRFDMNGDGRGDLVWRNPGSKQTAGWLMNGTQIQAGLVLPQPNNLPNADIVDVADFNGDGKGDLVWFEANNGWFITTQDGLNTTSQSLALAIVGAQYVTYGDFNGDGRMDLLTFSGAESNSHYATRLSGLSPNASGQGLVVPGLTDGKPVLVADLDGDGRDDIVFQNSDGSMIFCGMDAAGFDCGSSRAILGAGNDAVIVAAGDFNADRRMDLVVETPAGLTKVLLMDANGGAISLSNTILNAGSGWHVVSAPDLDGDGKADLVFRKDDGAYAAWLMNGAFAKAYGTFLGAGTGWELKQARDLNGDGKADLIWRHADGRYGPWIMNGLSAYAYATFFGPGTGWEIRP